MSALMTLDMDIVTHAAPPHSAEHSDISWCSDLDSLTAEKTIRDAPLSASFLASAKHAGASLPHLPAQPAASPQCDADGGSDCADDSGEAGPIHRCCKCGAGIDGRQWFMAGNRKHCSVACSTHTALRLERDDPALRDGTSAADLVAGIAEDEE